MPFQVIAVGEILWDLLPAGRQLGGAPANYVQHAGALGASAAMVSRVGADDLGREAVARLRERGVAVELIQVDAEAPTGTVGVALGADGQPQYAIHERVAWDRLAVQPAALTALRAADAVCFGSLSQRTAGGAAAVRRLVAAAPAQALRIFDVNFRPPFVTAEAVTASLALANVLKLNDQELPELAEMLGLPGDADDQLAALLQRYELRLIALTRGAAGSRLVSRDDVSDQPAVKTVVKDTVGAGDSFTAALTLGLLHGWPLDAINRRAAEVAAYVCTQPGGAPDLPTDLRQHYTRRA